MGRHGGKFQFWDQNTEVHMQNNCWVLTLKTAVLTVATALTASAAPPDKSLPSAIVIDARTAPPKPQSLPFPAGGQSSGAHHLSVNSRYLLRDGKPWFPVMGEFQFSRYPEVGWEKEILKMKAGGIQVISTYIFWIHHEELEGQFDWTEQRNLRRFVELCAKHDMYVWVRVGPWDHGEVRNGGLPDWLLQKTPTRESNTVYLDHVRRFFGEIAKQLDGLFWKNGGPIIGVQIENEYSARGPGKGAEHILELRRLAREVGLDAPFYTVTGWDNAAIPSREVLPVFGGYADGFWWRSLVELPPNSNYFFTNIRCEENVGDDLHSKRPDIDAMDAAYPFLTAEMGGGMELSYHRRPRLSVDDTAAMEVVKLGSGVVLYGYYMFHGGTNPDGKQTTLQESQATGYPNDLPVKNYDFQAPLGEFGQMNPSYRALKTFHLFLGDFGSSLASMTSYLPEHMPQSKQDISTPRVAARLDGDHGFLFINNHERTYRLLEHKNFQVKLELPSGIVDVPRHPVNVPSDAYTIWPVNLDLGGTVLRYATAQLLCKLDDPQTYVFFAWPGISTEFAFETKKGTSIESLAGHITRDKGMVYVDQIEPRTQTAMQIRNLAGAKINIVLLPREQALNIWKAPLAGRDRLILSGAQLYFDQNRVHVLATDFSQLKTAVFPTLDHVPAGFNPDGDDGIFKVYTAHVEQVSSAAKIEKVQEVGADPPLKLGKEVVLVPDEAAFDTAARWTLNVPRVESSAASNIFLRITYEGDIARLYADGKLLTDNFYNGTPWLIGLDRIPQQTWDRLELKILPLQDHAPIYLPEGARPVVSPGGQVAILNGVQVVPEYEVVMDVKP
jgi:beta-galactosidase